MERVELKDVRLPENLQRSMAAEAEAAREAKAKVRFEISFYIIFSDIDISTNVVLEDNCLRR